jgi:hypothetical protein
MTRDAKRQRVNDMVVRYRREGHSATPVAVEHDAGLRDDDDEITFDVHAYKTERDYLRCQPTTIIDGIVGCDDANKEARKWLSDHAVVKVQSSDRETIEVLRAESSDPSQPSQAVGGERTWYESSTGNHQGLIVEEETGRNIAVTFDKADAPVITRAVNNHAQLVATLRNVLAYSTGKTENIDNLKAKLADCAEVAREALRLAKDGE